MTNLTVTQPLSIDQELGDLQRYKYHPNAIVQIGLNRLQDMLQGRVKMVEPSTPFTYLLESSSINTAFAVQEFALLSRKLYPRLANSDEDLYLHMSDYDYLGRFAEPSYARVSFNILFNDFTTHAHYDAQRKEHVFKLPRHLKVTVGAYCFMLTSAVVMRLSESGVVDVRFENQDFNNIFPLRTNHIDFHLKRVNNDEQYISFELQLPEVDIEVSELPLDRTALIRGALSYSPERSFYYCRAFHQVDGEWREMLVTHTQEVYDINTPTCIIKVLESTHEVQYSIPTVYVNSGLVSGRVRVLLYTTRGHTRADFGDFSVSEFQTEYADVFPETELDLYTAPIQLVTKIIFIKEAVSSGKAALTFEQLKAAVLDNSIGDRKLPITAKQLEFSANQLNFQLIKDIDIFTHRVYHLQTDTPAPTTRYPISKTNLDILECVGTVDALRQGNGSRSYGEHLTALEQGTLFELHEGRLVQLDRARAENVRAMSAEALTEHVNEQNYLSLYYHYVLDTSENTAQLRAYDLSRAHVALSSFKSFNPSARIGANSTTSNLYKTPYGYVLDVLANAKEFSPLVQTSSLTPYLVHTDQAGARFYLAGTLFTTISEQPVYRFILGSEYLIDRHHRLTVSGFRDANHDPVQLPVGLLQTFEVLYTTSLYPPGYEGSAIDEVIAGSFLSGVAYGVTLETLQLSFGEHLARLFTPVRTSVTHYEYLTYETDEPLRYTQSVYSSDNELIHHVGDVVLDEQGEVVIAHPKGSVRMDDNGVGIPVPSTQVQRHLGLLLTDHRTTLCTASADKQYLAGVRQHITRVCLDEAAQFQQQLLDNSQSYVTVPKTIGEVLIYTGSREVSIASAQRFAFTVYVGYETFHSAQIRDSISYVITKQLDDYLYQETQLKRTHLLERLFDQLRQFSVTLSVDQFTELNEEYLEIKTPGARLSMAKQLVNSANGYQMREDITVNFKLV